MKESACSAIYTDYVGISVSIISTLFVLARIWDALSAPIFGVIIDRANLKGGVVRLYLALRSDWNRISQNPNEPNWRTT
ncbi:MFS transporter [Paenibacillus sp. SEL2]